MALTAGNPSRAITVWLTIVVFSLLAHNVNYLVGRNLGAHSRWLKANRNTIKKDVRSLWFLCLSTFWHPHFATVTSAACGAEGVPYGQFIIIVSIAGLLWYIFWGILFYFAGLSTSFGANLLPISIAYIFLWATWDIFRFYKRRNG
jgi:membrane protein DedA with SNARE-associated domain